MAAETISPSRTTSQFWSGVRLAVPATVAAGPFAILYGALAAKQGLSFFEIVLMSVTIFGGASQMVGIELFGQRLPGWIVVLSIFAVNFRHVLYSAAVGRRIAHWPAWQQAVGFFFLVDPVYAESERRIEAGEKIGFVWYMGIGLTIYVAWVMISAVGAWFGALIPDTHAIGLDFLLPIYFLGLVMGFRKRESWWPVVVASALASIAAYLVVGSPWHVSIGAMAGIIVAAMIVDTGSAEPARTSPIGEPQGQER